MRETVLAIALIACVALPAIGQACPKSNQNGPTIPSDVRTLEGNLVFHDGIRTWFELKLDKPQCDQTSIELVPGNLPSLQILRGCRVQSKGPIDFSRTGYYSLDTYQSVDEIQAVGTCARKPPFPDYSAAKPDKAVQAYRVDMHLNYTREDRPIEFRVSNSGKELRPWQAYASYILTGGFVLYGQCGEGFIVDGVFGPSQARPGHSDKPHAAGDQASFDPESAAASGHTDLHLGYTCVRSR